MQWHLTLSDSGFLFQQRAKEIVALTDKARREIAEQEERIGGIVTIACVESVASHNLPTNGLILVQQGIGCLICVQGSLAIRPPQGIRFVPLAPERITGHVLAWKKVMPSARPLLAFSNLSSQGTAILPLPSSHKEKAASSK